MFFLNPAMAPYGQKIKPKLFSTPKAAMICFLSLPFFLLHLL